LKQSKGSKSSNQQDALRSSYEAVRSEILLRIRVRTQIIAFFVISSATFAGYLISAAKASDQINLLLVIAIFSFSVAVMVAHQDMCIGIAAHHCAKKIKPKFGGNVMWNNCAASTENANVRRRLRVAGQLLIIISPFVLSYTYIVNKGYHGCYHAMLCTPQSIISLVIMILAVFILYRVTLYRGKMHKKSKEYFT